MNTSQVSLPEPPETGRCEKHGEFEIRTAGYGAATIRVERCPACSKEDAAREESKRLEKERAERQAKIEARLDQAGIPPLFRDRSFDNYEVKTESQRAALGKFKSFAVNFPTHRKTGTVLVGMGRVGTGKSHLACACANYLMSQGVTAYYTSTSRLFTKIRSTWAKSASISEEQLLKQLEQIDLMIVDEVGVQRGTDDEQRTLHELLEARRLNRKPTILLTNLDWANLKAYIGERFTDRMIESGVSVLFDWESHRRQSRDVGGLDSHGEAA